MKNFHFNNHPEIKEGQHAIFAPSQKLLSRSELTPEQLDNIIRSKYAAQIGTIIHAEAARMILQKKSVTKTKVADRIYDALWQANIPNKLNTPELYLDTVVPYIKDAIGFDMSPEQPIVYNYQIAFGTADCIRYNPVKHELRIHDLKTGVVPAHMEQLEIYAALFCLEYGKQYNFKPVDGSIELRIYQNDDVNTYNPTAEDIVPIMDKIMTFDKYINKWQEENQ